MLRGFFLLLNFTPAVTSFIILTMKKGELIALLVDGDNAQAKVIKPIIEEVSKYGKVTIRRIYGDWTTTHMSSWKQILNDTSFTPIQKFSYTTGKNSTDSALIIDAMDILHSGIVDGFCIVSSDSDYTGLAKRIREEGLFVMGVGVKSTPTAFVQSCEVFTFVETIVSVEENDAGNKSSIKAIGKQPHTTRPKVNLGLVQKAVEMSINENEQAYIATVGSNLRKIDPSFDPRNFGFRTLTSLFAGLPGYEVSDLNVNGAVQKMVKKKKST
jgi:hypothetical protein